MSTVNPNLSELADGSAYYGNVDVGVSRLAVEDMVQNARLDALEAMARGYQEDGALVLERAHQSHPDEMHRELMRQPTDPPTSREIRDALRLAGAYRKRAETAERERDEARAQQTSAFASMSMAITERDQARRDCDVQAEQHGRVLAERDALREALVKYGRHDHTCEITQAMSMSITPGRKIVCTCGFVDVFAAALATATPAEVGEQETCLTCGAPFVNGRCSKFYGEATP